MALAIVPGMPYLTSPRRAAPHLAKVPVALACVLFLAAAVGPLPAAAAAPSALRAAFEAAARGDVQAARKAGLADHPLAGWIEYAALVEGIDDLPVARGADFLARHRDKAVGAAFRRTGHALGGVFGRGYDGPVETLCFRLYLNQRATARRSGAG